MVKVILCGCNGKMGKVITETLNSFPEINIVAGIDKTSNSKVSYPIFDSIDQCSVESDVILDFSRPDALDSLISYCKRNNLPLVLCTTGYSQEQIDKITSTSKEIPIFRSANMSIGINIVNSILKNISEKLYKNFDIEIIEKHHNQKVDAPSGTALLLANTIKDSIPEKTEFNYGREGLSKRNPNEIGIHAIRGGSIVGEHQIIFAGIGETIEISHNAISREVFAIGALKACEFMKSKSVGLYDMDNVIKRL
ncbi:4-hydroxy-tetrahydrodipicolinate reductase [Clostridium tetanomorphum]|uniref:4-hydroxy-tetrahydrodipicolinate reductase n=1 Tax=Clostridium tetanomorphum TaxID=1553 RepID=A0A923E848_CLOTT|nr:4-hydroxy-tetrahydrodipicolinate reductase [Clostridium tetanomorphum]KAJ50446.1 dihydrodipicolinate reductase [Clostridium tetanomorphum DSM 665]MBC2398235.1 4-hydroxy-tetrahydrodipicolinate reductase [Clostridium tetanomorphum]MBP1865646.1 4-hydroxy-tetrahydrodipicolinate reductase [Clostridium tetanomorphum]NRS85848.1 4-hydroxy-tetrahydrodipicolinate reductase [Clostridium tetanomorphum]NRZ96144.1 4-hydroxy-tetrahydrodipicolinate reductase [Clostridium tetanomorphum]